LKLIVCGHAGHGKDYVSERLANALNITYSSSTAFVASALNIMHLLEDKDSNRVRLYNAIRTYTQNDPSRLVRELFELYDIYCGLRSAEELKASKPLSSLVIWVHRPGFPPEGDSNKIIPEMCDITLINDYQVESRIARLASALR